MTAFDRALSDLFAHEGIESDDPRDAGGHTRFGISKAAYPDVDIASLTREDAAAIYRRDYWERPKLDKLPAVIAIKLFNVAVNIGPIPAVMMLQKALRILGADITVDGVVGTATLGAVGRYPADVIVAIICVQQGKHYESIIESKPSQRRFAGGWFRRCLYNPVIKDAHGG